MKYDMPALKQLLAAKIQSSGLKITAAAKKAGISFPSFHAAVIGKATPNARSVSKYAKFLGISAEEVMHAAGKKAVGKSTKAATGKPGRRGRPLGSKNKAKGAAGSTPKAPPRIAKALAKAAASLEKLAAVLKGVG